MFLISFPRVEVCASTATREAAGYETKKNVEKTALNHFLRLQDVLIFRIYKIANSKRVS